MCFGALGRVPSTISPTTRGEFCNPSSPRIFRVQDQGILQLSGLSGLSWSYLGALPRTLALKIRGNLPWLCHWKGFILVRRSSSSLDWSLRSFFSVPGCCSLGSGPGNSAYMELKLVLCSGALRRILSSALWIGSSLQINLASVIIYV